MKILQVVDYGYVNGGAEKCVSLLKENLIQRGHEVMVLSTSDRARAAYAKHFGDLEFAKIDNVGRTIVGETIKHLWYTKSYSALRKAVKDFKPDVIHIHNTWQSSPSILFATRKVPTVLTVHGPEEYMSSIFMWSIPQKRFINGDKESKNYTAMGRISVVYHRYIQRPLYKAGFRYSLKKLIAPSKYMACVLEEENFGVPIKQIHNGVELPSHTELGNRSHILFVGRLDYVKGIHILLQSMSEIVKEIPNAHLDIVGDGNMRNELEKIATSKGLVDSVVFHGWLNGDKLSNMYRAATVVSIPSIWPENFPTVCIEALAYGRPVVGSNVGGIPEIINSNKLGRIVPPGDPAKLAEAIISTLNDGELDNFVSACALSAQRFTLERYIDNHEKMYKELTR